MKKGAWERFFEKSVGDFFSKLKGSTGELGMTFDILIKEEDNMFIAHCLELDIVATANSIDQAQRDIVSLICAQIDFAFTHNNLKYLYRPAPQEVWEMFFACKERWERKYPIYSAFKKDTIEKSFVPAWLIAKTCHAPRACHL